MKPFKISCIYFIRCLANGRIYVGSTKDFVQRKTDHFKELRKGIHINQKLQRAFRKYGESYFVMEMFCVIQENILVQEEQYWINALDVVKRGFNIAKFASSGFRGRTWSEKMRSAIMKKRKGMFAGPKNPFFGKRHSEELKHRLSSERARIFGVGEKNPFFGKRHTAATRLKMKAAHARSHRMVGAGNINWGKKRPPHVTEALRKANEKRYYFVNPEGLPVVFVNMKHFCVSNRLSETCMRRVLRGESVSHKGWMDNRREAEAILFLTP